MDKLKLKWKIFACLTGFSALLLVILWLFQTIFLNDMYKLIRKNEIKKAITAVEKNIDSPDLVKVIQNLRYDNDILVGYSYEFLVPVRPGQNELVKLQPETITQTEEFILKDGRKISMTFYAMITPVNATVSTLKVQLYIIIGIMLVLSTIIAIFISRTISKPIEDINKSAKILASGDYNTHFAGGGFLEIKELSDTLNTAASELSKVEKFRRELMANISHDLRTPLALIFSHAEMMFDFPDEITPEQTKLIMDETKRLTSLVNDILDISQFETGKTEVNIKRYSLTLSLKNTVDRMAMLVGKNGFSLEFDYDGEAFVAADEVKITQAFYNLLLNAVNYCGNDKNITIRQIMSDGKVRIEVIDRGEGISRENLPYIWERYYKVQNKHKRAVTGTGLGLSIVKKIMECHNAVYGAESELGKGSRFWFELDIR